MRNCDAHKQKVMAGFLQRPEPPRIDPLKPTPLEWVPESSEQVDFGSLWMYPHRTAPKPTAGNGFCVALTEIAGPERRSTPAQTIRVAIQREGLSAGDHICMHGNKAVGHRVQDNLLAIGGGLNRGSLAEGFGVVKIRWFSVPIDRSGAAAIYDFEGTVHDDTVGCGIGNKCELGSRLVFRFATKDGFQATDIGQISNLLRAGRGVIELAYKLVDNLVFTNRY